MSPENEICLVVNGEVCYPDRFNKYRRYSCQGCPVGIKKLREEQKARVGEKAAKEVTLARDQRPTRR